MKETNPLLRIGQINFTNVWPVFHYFPRQRFEGRVQYSEMVPTGLNRAIADGAIDIAPISSFAYAAYADRLMILPDLSVSAKDRVHSILLFHRKPLEELDGSVVALTDASATSVNLLKILLERFYGAKPVYRTERPDLQAMMKDADAALLIGDDAIRASWTDSGYEVTDLAELWNRRTGAGMTFALWSIRSESAEGRPELVREIFEAFQESKRKGLDDPGPIIDRAVAKIGGAPAYWENYFRTLDHDFGEEQQRGLSLYFRYAYELGLLPEPVQFRIWKP